MTEVLKEGKVSKRPRPIRSLSEALNIDPTRFKFLGTVLTQSFRNDESAMDTVKMAMDLRHDGKINDNEQAFLIFQCAWVTALNAVNREIDNSIKGIMVLDKDTGEVLWA